MNRAYRYICVGLLISIFYIEASEGQTRTTRASQRRVVKAEGKPAPATQRTPKRSEPRPMPPSRRQIYNDLGALNAEVIDTIVTIKDRSDRSSQAAELKQKLNTIKKSARKGDIDAAVERRIKEVTGSINYELEIVSDLSELSVSDLKKIQTKDIGDALKSGDITVSQYSKILNARKSLMQSARDKIVPAQCVGLKNDIEWSESALKVNGVNYKSRFDQDNIQKIKKQCKIK